MSGDESAKRRLAFMQGGFWVATGAWPLLGLKSFFKVTGSKRERWSVKTVGVLVSAIGSTLLRAGARRQVTDEIRWLAVSSALGLAAIDVLYASRGRISPIYLLDAAIEVALVGGWLATLTRPASRPVARQEGERPASTREDHGAWNIAPGETRQANGRRDLVTEASMESFPASDPPVIP